MTAQPLKELTPAGERNFLAGFRAAQASAPETAKQIEPSAANAADLALRIVQAMATARASGIDLGAAVVAALKALENPT